jgi:hypothetical protein
MFSIHWGHGPASMAICPRWQTPNTPSPLTTGRDADHEWAPVEVCGRDHARLALGQGLEQAQALRRLLSSEGDANVWRLSDHQVTDQVADHLDHRRWVLFSLVLTAQAKARYAIQQVALPVTQPERGASPFGSKVRGGESSPEIQAPARHPETDFASVDQLAQAATLRLAASSGVPFCAVCEKARQAQREARLAAA